MLGRPEATMTTRATGSFEIDTWDPETIIEADGWQLGRVRLAKRFQGDLEASGVVEMLSAVIDGTPTAYVAIERIEGRLAGKEGALLVQHAAPSGDVPIRLSIVAGSGRRAWAGISGDFSIDVAPDGSHSYTIDYTLGDSNVGEP